MYQNLNDILKDPEYKNFVKSSDSIIDDGENLNYSLEIPDDDSYQDVEINKL